MVTKEEVQNIAILSKLDVSDTELDSLTKDMQRIIAFADTVNQVGVDAGEFDNINGLSNVLREDVVIPSYPREEILKIVQGGEDGFFLVRKRG